MSKQDIGKSSAYKQQSEFASAHNSELGPPSDQFQQLMEPSAEDINIVVSTKAFPSSLLLKLTKQTSNEEKIPVSNLIELFRILKVNLNDDCSFEMDGLRYGINLGEFSLTNPRDYIFQKSPLGQHLSVRPHKSAHDVLKSQNLVDQAVQTVDDDTSSNNSKLVIEVVKPKPKRPATASTAIKQLNSAKTLPHTQSQTDHVQGNLTQRTNTAKLPAMPSFKKSTTIVQGHDKKRLSDSAFEELNHVNSKMQQLQQELQQTQQKYKDLNSMFIDHDNVAESKLHLALLYASPLVMRYNGGTGKDTFKSMPQLEFKKEFKQIVDSIKKTEFDVKVKSMQATIENLPLILAEKPLALHFSGHGIENNEKNFGKDHILKKKEGNYLLFETEDGEGELVSEKRLHECISQSKHTFEFVFMASCNSEPVGRIFLNLGAKHVICVKDGQEIADQAVIIFSQSFYHSVFSQKLSVCASYNIARNQVQIRFGSGESDKFSLLTKEGNKAAPPAVTANNHRNMPEIDFDDDEFNIELPADFGLPSAKPLPPPPVVQLTPKIVLPPNEEHQCKVFGPLKKGTVSIIYDNNPRFAEIPAKVDKFIGRQPEMQDIICNVLDERLVNIIGLPGIGKTSLVKNVVDYLAERKLFKTGIIFLSLKGYLNTELFLKKLVVSFVSDNFELEEEEKAAIKQGNTEQLIKISLSFLRQLEERILLVFDNVEDILYHDKMVFRNLIQSLVSTCPKLHILMTSRTTLGTLQDVKEQIIVLQELNQMYTVELFKSRSRKITKEEKKELLTCETVKSRGKQGKVLTTLGEHPLFKMFGGNPHAITLAAPLLLKMSLKDLYLLLSSEEMHDVLKVDGITDSTVASLRLSLEASIKVLEKEDKKCLQLFFLIGMLPGGVYEEDLVEIWGSSCSKYITQLINFSLIQKKEDDDKDKKTKYILPPFMSNYAEAKIPEEDRIKFQNDICCYYAKVCKQILENNNRVVKGKESQSAEQTRQSMERLLSHETNLWACIYRLVKKPVTLQQITEESKEAIETKEEVQKRMRKFSTLIDKSPRPNLVTQNTLTSALFGLGESFKMQKSLGDNSLLSSAKKEPEEEKKIEIKSAHNVLQILAKGISNRRRSVVDKTAPTITSQGVIALLKQEIANRLPAKKKHASYSQHDFDKIKEAKESDEDSFGTDSDPEDYSDSEDDTTEDQGKTEDKLQSIIKNSIVNFMRPQVGNSVELQSMMQNETLQSQTTGGAFSRSQTLAVSKQKSSVSNGELHHAEQMILYYALNLFLFSEYDNSQHLIQEYGLKIKGCGLFQANLKRILALIYFRIEQPQKAIETLKDAKDQFIMLKCTYGQAQCNFGLGFILAKHGQSEDQKAESRQCLDNALKQYLEVYHIFGQVHCYKQLVNHLEHSTNNQSQLQHYQECFNKLQKQVSDYPKKGPYVERTQGPEISLLCEIITSSQAKDLYMELKPTLTSKSTARNAVSQQRQGSKPSFNTNHAIRPQTIVATISLEGPTIVNKKVVPPIHNPTQLLAVIEEHPHTRKLSERDSKNPSFVTNMSKHSDTSSKKSLPSARRTGILKGQISDSVARLSQTVGLKKQVTKK